MKNVLFKKPTLILITIYELEMSNKKIYISELMRKTNLTWGTVKKNIIEFKNFGIVEIFKTKNKRENHIKLTEYGKKLCNMLYDVFDELEKNKNFINE